MKLTVKNIPITDMPFLTIGHWYYDNNELTILLAEMSDVRFSTSVLMHEVTEACWCIWKGVTTKECDDFDAYYEGLYLQHKIKLSKEAGYDWKCPYHWGHVFGDVVAFLFCIFTGIKPRKYNAEAKKLMDIYIKSKGILK